MEQVKLVATLPQEPLAYSDAESARGCKRSCWAFREHESSAAF